MSLATFYVDGVAIYSGATGTIFGDDPIDIPNLINKHMDVNGKSMKIISILRFQADDGDNLYVTLEPANEIK
jgi:hypothetical protein